MAVYYPEQDPGAVSRALAERPGGRLVACLCADWCGTCKQYQDGFAVLAARYPNDCFVWIDVETHSDTLGEDIDIENFPTVLIQPVAGGAPHFYGTVLPHLDVLDRMLARGAAMPAAASQFPEVLPWLLGQGTGNG
ncbi:thioredoxin family protein [Cupriavidus agavae]|uniref:Thiol-disulfide isomerase/thioredoxin n=1 Tax=Cupriavidus agavae TaxID=1001822 RepID=A0A4V2FGY6_9BURK|nr:thioredoxin family protein [Cupriavidus agavae]RZT38409.1 thiol-disulfide isomerase/thioredoxin [Cupriavidus agavae]